VNTDPFELLRPVDPAPPDPRFVARLRRRLEAALAPTDLRVIDLPERSTTMTDTTATTTTAITPYLCVSPATEALAWYRDHFDAVETIRYTGDDGRIGHAEITIGGAVVMLSDEYPELEVLAPTTIGGTSTTLHVTVPDVDATYARVVAGGGRPSRPPKDEAYGARSFSMLDPFGHRWMIQTPTGSPSVEEIQAQTSDYTITTPEDPPEAVSS
jgi:PhnB protein